jgi:Peptidase_C39 like family
MKAISHKIKHQYQPTPTSCSQTSLSTLLGHYGINISPLDVEAKVPQVKDEAGNDNGTITQLLAAWVATQNFDVSLYTFDCQIIDQTWSKLKSSEIQDRLEAGLSGWVVPGLGEESSRSYRQAYIDYLNTNGKLIIEPYVTTKLLYSLLEDGPIFTSVCFNTLYASGRTDDGSVGLDDVNGRAWNHSIVVYGNDDDGNLLIADPIVKPGLHAVEPERMIASITAAQIECDNLLFQIKS